MSFSNKKEDLIKFIKDLINCLKFISSKEEIITKYDKILKEFRLKNANYDVQNIIENLENNLSMVERTIMVTRSTMKYVFIGGISNGKSCTINAVLKQEILPSSVGRTTSCFVSIKGYDGDEIYLEDTHGKRYPIVDLQRLRKQLVHQFFDETCSFDSLLRVFIPRNMCEFLKNDVEIIDCPGADYVSNHDAAIIKHCKDSDVFVLVFHAECTLSRSDRELLKNLRGILSNLIIVFNKWDFVENLKENEIIEKIRKQHQDVINKLLVEDLAMYSLSEAKERTFFISSLKEVKKIGSDNNPSLEFNRFKDALIESNEHSIEFKIKKFRQAAQQKKDLTLDFLSDLPKFIVRSKTCDCNTMKQQIMMKSKNKISEIFKNIYEESEKLQHDIASRLTNIIMKAIEKIDDEFMAIDEDNLVLNLSKCFENNMKSLPDQIKEISIQYSCIDTHGDKMERFSKLRTHLDKSIKEYKEHIENKIKQISLDFQKQFQNKKNKKDSSDMIAIYLKDQIKSDVKKIFSRAIKMYSKELHRLTIKIVKDCLYEFIEDQRNMDDLLMTFDNLRVQIEKVSI